MNLLQNRKNEDYSVQRQINSTPECIRMFERCSLGKGSTKECSCHRKMGFITIDDVPEKYNKIKEG